jgi:hypothetical protein
VIVTNAVSFHVRSSINVETGWLYLFTISIGEHAWYVKAIGFCFL